MKAVLMTGFACVTFVACLGIAKNVPISATVTATGSLVLAVGAAAVGKS